MQKALIGGKIITPFRIIKEGAILIEDNKIVELGEVDQVTIPKNCEIIPTKGQAVCPGFVDLLIHGALGHSFSEGNDEDYEIISNHFLKFGSTTLMASMYAQPHDQFLNAIKSLARYIKKHPNSNIKGIHLEGPYLNKAFKGAMNEDWLWQPTIESWNKLWDVSEGLVKLMTIAPELPGAIPVIREAAKKGVIISIGHSMANYKEIMLAIDNGAAHVTHMFNAMRHLQHREPGVALAALLRDELKIELIADTYHVHPATMEFLLKVKKPNGIVLITDSITPGGMHEGEEFKFANQTVRIKGGKAMLDDGTIAGSTLTLNRAVKNMVETAGARITEAMRMASLNGAKVIGMADRIGILAVGKDADMVVLGDDYEVEKTILQGSVVYSRT
jgi:N-acetylglucosamine-6-phosphate deacetylase